MEKKGSFDAEGFYESLDAERQGRRLNWKQVAAASGVSASTLTRMAQGKRPDVDGLAALAAWSGLTVDDFVRTEDERPEPEALAKIATYLRSDRNLSPEAASALDGMIRGHIRETSKRQVGDMAFQRGFKTWAKQIAADTRGELGLSLFDRLDPYRLAESLAIPVIRLSDLVGDAPEVAHLITEEPEAFSAVTVFEGRKRVIVHNDGHARVRINSDICHEISHGLLGHPPTPALDDSGCRIWNQDIEDEASWLSGCLLVPEEAAMAIARGRWTVETAAKRFDVSAPMINFRLNATGARVRVARERRRRVA